MLDVESKQKQKLEEKIEKMSKQAAAHQDGDLSSELKEVHT